MTGSDPETREFEAAMQNVARAFATPGEIVRSNRLTREQKLKLLQQWDYDLGLLLVASEENMGTPQPNMAAENLRRVRAAIAELHAAVDSDHGAPGKISAVHIAEIDDVPATPADGSGER